MRPMRQMLTICAMVLGLCVTGLLAQHGGKAEPYRIEFFAGKTSTTLSVSLSRDEEMEYVFAAQKGQKVTIRNNKTSLFDVRIFSEEFGVETEFDSSPVFSIDLPQTGDYMLFVRKKRVKTRSRAKFLITLTIK
jgi:hypothetical protein